VSALCNANALRIPLADESVHMVCTSPPYWGLRSYGIGTDNGELGLEATIDEYCANMVAVFREVRRVLRDDGVLWLNMGDSYNSGSEIGRHDAVSGRLNSVKWDGKERQYGVRNTGLKPKDLCGVPWRVAFALQADGWWLRSDCIWAKPNPMPESVTDRPTKSHEYVFLLTKSANYFYDADAVREEYAQASIERQKYPEGTWDKGIFNTKHTDKRTMVEPNPSGRNLRTVWTIATAPYSGAHFATFPPALVERCIRAGTSERGACPECGKQWEREVEASQYTPEIVPDGIRFVDVSRQDKNRKLSGREYNKQVNRNTLGWRPTCDHYDDMYLKLTPRPRSSRKRAQQDAQFSWWWRRVRKNAIPPGWFSEEYQELVPQDAVVFDPFVGSGTTVAVAQQLGRRGVGIDLSMPYLHLARERTGAAAWSEWTRTKQSEGKKNGKENNLEDLPMFREMR